MASRQFGHLVAQQDLAGQGRGVDHRPAREWVLHASQARRRKPTSNGALWATITVPWAKARNDGSTWRSGGASATIWLVMPVSTAISGGMCGLRVDKGLELAEHLAAAHLDRADLGDHVGLGAAGGLQVNNAERDLGQMRPKIIKRGL